MVENLTDEELLRARRSLSARPRLLPAERVCLCLAEVAGILGVSRSTLHKLRQDPRFPKPRNLAGALRWMHSEIEEFADRCMSGAQYHERMGGDRRRTHVAKPAEHCSQEAVPHTA